MFEFNKEQAKKVIQTQIRNMRGDLFKELDVAYLRAVEMGDTELQSQISAKKQTLRDLTDIDVNSFNNREEWLALWPEDILGKNPYI